MKKTENKEYLLIKKIVLGSSSIEPNDIPFEFKNGRYIRGIMPLPDFIDINNPDYFKQYVKAKFKIGEYVLFKEFTTAWQPQRITDIKIVNNESVYEIENIINHGSKLKVSEKVLCKTAEYYFINSDGKVQREFYGIHPMKDNWLIGSLKFYSKKEDAAEAAKTEANIGRLVLFEKNNGIS